MIFFSAPAALLAASPECPPKEQQEQNVATLTLQQAFEASQKNETAWLNCKAELAAAEQEYR
ncbi:hypothetical protein KoxyNG13_035570 [Klebsiella pasteurii]